MGADSKKALTGMILSIVALVLVWYFAAGWIGLIFSIAALVLAIIAMNKLKPLKGMTENPGRVFVKVGSILSIIALILAIISIVLCVVCGIVACSANAISSFNY